VSAVKGIADAAAITSMAAEASQGPQAEESGDIEFEEVEVEVEVEEEEDEGTDGEPDQTWRDAVNESSHRPASISTDEQASDTGKNSEECTLTEAPPSASKPPPASIVHTDMGKVEAPSSSYPSDFDAIDTAMQNFMGNLQNKFTTVFSSSNEHAASAATGFASFTSSLGSLFGAVAPKQAERQAEAKKKVTS
jgi:hypothetical protein